jgi:hypothetical protein
MLMLSETKDSQISSTALSFCASALENVEVKVILDSGGYQL